MATGKGQRIGIWIITVVLVVGTLGGFAAMVLQPSNDKIDQESQQKAYEEYIKQQEESNKARLASSKPLDGFTSGSFDKSSITELKVEVLKEGDGAAITADSTVTVNYFGWTSDATIFDSTNQDGTVKPVSLGLTDVIEGWKQGLNGIRAGSIVKLSIPADLAYGSAGSPPAIGPNEPLQFIIQVVSVE